VDTKLIIALSVLEAIALVVIVRLWLRRRSRMSVVARLVWSVVLLVPGFGLMMYGFIHSDPDEHPDYIEEFGSADDVGGGHGADGH
jgi:hypothetical protein